MNLQQTHLPRLCTKFLRESRTFRHHQEITKSMPEEELSIQLISLKLRKKLKKGKMVMSLKVQTQASQIIISHTISIVAKAFLIVTSLEALTQLIRAEIR